MDIRFEHVASELNSVSQALTLFQSEVRGRMTSIEARLGGIEARMIAAETRLERLEEQLTAGFENFGTVINQLVAVITAQSAQMAQLIAHFSHQPAPPQNYINLS
jgi:hypothetical protein